MKMRFHGACGVVPGSMIELMDEKLGVHFLVDCGAGQGVDTSQEDMDGFSFDPTTIDFVLLTHAHADHCGRLPELVRSGFKGPVYCTEATSKLARLALLDAARQRGSRFCEADVERIQWNTLNREPYARPLPVAQDVFVQCHRSSHLLGAVSWSINWGTQRKMNPMLIISGDVGSHHTKEDGLGGLIANNQPPHAFAESGHTTLVLESTYGARAAAPVTRAQRREALLKLLMQVVEEDGKLLLPAFALGRLQEVLLDIYVLKYVTNKYDLEALKVFTPGHGMALEASKVYVDQMFKSTSRHMKKNEYREAINDVRLLWANRRMFAELGLGVEDHAKAGEARTMLKHALGLEGAACCTVSSPEEFVRAQGPGVFVAPSGMGDNGMMAGALKSLVTVDRTTVGLVGYVAGGTVLSRLQDMLKLSPNDRERQNDLLWLDETITAAKLRAKLVVLEGYGGHAPASTLWRYIIPEDTKKEEARKYKPVDTVYLVHGAEQARRDLAASFAAQLEEVGVPAQLRLPSVQRWVDLEAQEDRAIARLVESLRPQLAELGELNWRALQRLFSEFSLAKPDGETTKGAK